METEKDPAKLIKQLMLAMDEDCAVRSTFAALSLDKTKFYMYVCLECKIMGLREGQGIAGNKSDFVYSGTA